MTNTPFITPPVNSPAMLTAAEADIGDDAEVIGVVLPSGARAYLVSAMTPISSHVVNEVVDGAPVTVTYCDQTDCVRVLTRSESSELIDIKVGGRREGDMLVMLDGIMYVQDDVNLPLTDLEFVRTDWKAWREQHPDTVVFVGPAEPETNDEPESTNETELNASTTENL